MNIEGKWFDGQTSKEAPAILSVSDDGRCFIRRIAEGLSQPPQEYFDPQISARIGSTPRYITFWGDEVFETEDNDGVDSLLELLKPNHWSRWVHTLESNRRHILLSLIILCVMGFVTVKYLVPTGSQMIAQKLPISILNTTSEQSLRLLDKTVLKPSKLDNKRKEQLREVFQPVLNEHPGLHLQVLFRSGHKVGANAFALPNGTLVFTDELIKLSTNNNELIAILSHEIGHIVHRHSLRRIIQNSILSFAILSITGDSSGISEMFLGLPLVLTELGYSRKFELEADQYAIESLHSFDIDPQYFADILSRLGASSEQEYDSRNDSKVGNYFSTHPDTRERVRIIHENR